MNRTRIAKQAKSASANRTGKTGSFDGFPPATLTFLKQLKTNNNREWFNEHKQQYESVILQPGLQFVELLRPGLGKVSPYFLAVAKRTGGSMMRIYRDIRFSKNKTPYKTNISFHFRHEMGKDVHAPGYYFHIEPGRVFLGAGIWQPDSPALRKIRDHIVEEDSQWRRIVKSRKLIHDFEFAGDRLKRPPRDFDPDHPFIEDLKRKDFMVVANLDESAISTRQLVDSVVQIMKRANPLMRFLCESLKIPF